MATTCVGALLNLILDPILIYGFDMGVVGAAVSGYASIRLLRYVADKGRFGAFAYYCWAAGVLTLVLTILH